MSARRRPSPLLLLGLVLGRRARDERGQALPLAAVGILMMCLGVIVTLNLGQAVHEKIRLQNNADAAAYSLAANLLPRSAHCHTPCSPPCWRQRSPIRHMTAGSSSWI